VIGDTCKVFELFMSAKKLEGENYMTNSFISVLICTIWNGLQVVLDDTNTSVQIKTLVTAMMVAFWKHWGSRWDCHNRAPHGRREMKTKGYTSTACIDGIVA
jgi:hypothetical protein